MLRKLGFYSLLIMLLSCGKNDEREREIAKIPVEVEVTRFDQLFASADAEDLPDLKLQFPYLFPAQYPDSVWVNKMTDTIQLEINREVAQEFADFSNVKQDLHLLFQHIKYYFPESKLPEVVTVTSDVDYRNKAVWTDDFLLISLDTYLGKDHHFYIGIQEYLKKNFENSQILPDVALSFGESVVPRPDSRVFLAHMIYYGKILYLKDRLIPFKTDAERIGYTSEELAWAEANEEEVWRYFVERQLLFETDSDLYTRFLYPAPFSKFYLQLDHESPARLGQYIGWQIVRQYMESTDKDIKQMLAADPETIFNLSNYKPKK